MINTAKVEIGSRAIVFGLGGIGLNVIQGLRLAGADQIVGVDLNDDKIEMGKHFGMTDFVNPSKVEGDLVAHLVELTGGGADYTFDATGNVNVMRTRLEARTKGGAKASSSAWPLRALKSPRVRSNWSQGASGAARPLAGHGAHGRAQNRRLVHGRQDRDRPDDHPQADIGPDQRGL